ncbi:MAG: ABC transporter ATP-binding protein [Opitutales bacterium]
MRTPDSPNLSADQLAVGYPHGASARCIASGLDLVLHAGEFVCLLGPNGTGKSTLIRTLSGMQSPLGGTIRIAGQNFHQIPPRQRAQLVSVVLTEALPMGMMDAYAMVALGRHPYSGWFGHLSDKDRMRIEWALGAVGAEALARRQVAELSDGERQKISIARALAQETQVMLLDEPTAFLDLPRRVELMTILRQLAHQEQLALLLSTHDLDLALRFADRLWVLDYSGRLIQGYPEAVAMSDDFVSIFESENLIWDPQLGSFRAHPSPCLFACVEGDGIPALWTKRALERLGFGLCEKPEEATLCFQIKDHSWQIHTSGRVLHYTSLSAVIEWILAEDWCGPGR